MHADSPDAIERALTNGLHDTNAQQTGDLWELLWCFRARLRHIPRQSMAAVVRNGLLRAVSCSSRPSPQVAAGIGVGRAAENGGIPRGGSSNNVGLSGAMT